MRLSVQSSDTILLSPFANSSQLTVGHNHKSWHRLLRLLYGGEHGGGTHGARGGHMGGSDGGQRGEGRKGRLQRGVKLVRKLKRGVKRCYSVTWIGGATMWEWGVRACASNVCGMALLSGYKPVLSHLTHSPTDVLSVLPL